MATLQAAGIGTSQYKGDSRLDEDEQNSDDDMDDAFDSTYGETNSDAEDHIIGYSLPDAANLCVDIGSTYSSFDVSNTDPGDQTKSLMFFFDYETSGLSMYKHHITELAAKVVAPSEVFISVTQFSALCYTALTITPSGDRFCIVC